MLATPTKEKVELSKFTIIVDIRVAFKATKRSSNRHLMCSFNMGSRDSLSSTDS